MFQKPLEQSTQTSKHWLKQAWRPYESQGRRTRFSRGTQTTTVACSNVKCQTEIMDDLEYSDGGHCDDDDGDYGDNEFDDPNWHYSESDNVDSSQSSEGDACSADIELAADSSDHIRERKFMVFESCIVKLLLVCCVCLSPCRVFLKKVIGGFVAIEQRCVHGHRRIWHNQPFYGSLPSGNLLTAACIFFSGSSQACAIFECIKTSPMATIALRTYNMIQSSYLTIAVKSVWLNNQEKLLHSLHGAVLNIGGDGRCCSPGHTAKFGSYSVMDLNSSKILDVQLVQVNEVTSSNAMELEGLKRCLNYLLPLASVHSITTDRHPSVQKYLRDCCPDILHYFDVWHIAKSVKKKIEAISKRRNCSILAHWAQAISNHLYWCAASSDGNGDLVLAKWLSILNHVCDIHSGHGELYNDCMHGLLEPRLWIQVGSKAHKELELIVANKLLCRDVKHLAFMAQTSAVESYHRVVTFFAPKSVHFFHSAMESRLLLAALHFNENCNRQQALTQDGKPQWRISFPKARKGSAVAAEVKVPVTFAYIDDLLSAVVNLRKQFPSYSKAKIKVQHTQTVKPPPVAATAVRMLKQDVVSAHAL